MQDLGDLVHLFPEISKGREELRTLGEEIIVLMKPSEIFLLSCLLQLVFSNLLEVPPDLVKNEYGIEFFLWKHVILGLHLCICLFYILFAVSGTLQSASRSCFVLFGWFLT